MTVRKNPWLYIAVCLIAITILITPLLAGLFLTLIEMLHAIANPLGRENDDLSTIMYIFWGLSLGYFTWPVFLIVLLPYCLAYMKFRFSGLSIGLKLVLFYSLLVLMGFIFPNASFVSLFMQSVSMKCLSFIFYLQYPYAPCVI